MLYGVDYKLPEKVKGLTDNQSTEVYAKDENDLMHILQARKMNEHPCFYHTIMAEDPELPSDLIKQKRYQEAMHAACWLGMVACKSGISDGFTLLNDEGGIHCLAHLLLPKKILDMQHPDFIKASHNRALEVMLELENKVPGFRMQVHKPYKKTKKNQVKEE